MRRLTVITGLVAVMAIGSATGAIADVHLVSEADCAAPGAPSGGIGSRHAIEDGRPAGQIPVTASGGKTQGKAGGAQGVNCLGI